jgi:tetratricopeptide (TPR) repeat protein
MRCCSIYSAAIRGCQKKIYEKVLELEPDNFEATNELRKIDQALTLKENSHPKEAATVSKPAAREKKPTKDQPGRQKVIAEKDLGNGFFKEGKYKQALECYIEGWQQTAPMLYYQLTERWSISIFRNMKKLKESAHKISY